MVQEKLSSGAQALTPRPKASKIAFDIVSLAQNAQAIIRVSKIPC